MPNLHTISRSKLGGQAMPQEDGLIAALKQTPLWNAFYKRTRRTTRFPRYYRKDLNW
ncbi:MAG: hypothetical protein MUE88_01555 [Flavobacteriales bacterium]|jgi:hypothetical protein|nr:hypothetical protein [Flavobacteriales bacterium]